MSDHSLPEGHVEPMPGFKSWMLYGTVAALFAGALAAAGSAIEWVQGESTEFSAASVLMLLATALEVVILIAILRLARTSPVRLEGLRRSSICLFGSVWVLMGFLTVVEFLPEASRWVLFVSLLGGVLGLGIFFCYAIKSPNPSLILAIYFGTKYLIGWLIQGRPFGTDVALGAAAGILAAGSLIGYPIWFAISLLQPRDLLGPSAVWLACVIFANVLAGLVFFGWVLVTLATAHREGLLAPESIDTVLAPFFSGVTVVGMVGELSLALATCVFFLAQRKRPLAASAEGAAPTPEAVI